MGALGPAPAEVTARLLLRLLREEEAVLAEMGSRLDAVAAATRAFDAEATRSASADVSALAERLSGLERERVEATGEGPGTLAALADGLPPGLVRELTEARDALLSRRRDLLAATARQARAAAHVAGFAAALAGEMRRRSEAPAYGPDGTRAVEAESGRLYRSAV